MQKTSSGVWVATAFIVALLMCLTLPAYGDEEPNINSFWRSYPNECPYNNVWGWLPALSSSRSIKDFDKCCRVKVFSIYFPRALSLLLWGGAAMVPLDLLFMPPIGCFI